MSLLLLSSVFLAVGSKAQTVTLDQAKRIYDRLAGVAPSSATLDSMRNMTAREAALFAMQDKHFYNVTLKNWVAPWTNRDMDVFVPLDDYIATVIGAVRDEIDYRRILYDDIIYLGVDAGLPAYSNINNDHYEALEASGADMGSIDVLQQQNQSSLSAITGIAAEGVAGIITTRSAAEAFFVDGTNRAQFRFTLLNHLCIDLEQLHDTSRVPDRIRQDVSRSPGGDSRVFLNNCVGCHAGMDPLTQALAYYDYKNDVNIDANGNETLIDPPIRLVYTPGVVQDKYFNNDTTFTPGFVTPDESWSNYWRVGQNSALGWDTNLPGSGVGARSMLQELAHSRQFAKCAVEKAFKAVCLREPRSDEVADVETMIDDFRSNNYNMKNVFADTAAYCMGD